MRRRRLHQEKVVKGDSTWGVDPGGAERIWAPPTRWAQRRLCFD
jgi:hypothetical protein